MRTYPVNGHRYVVRVCAIAMASGGREFWIGLESDEPLNVLEWDDLIPADDMTNEELSIVKSWIHV